MNAAAVIETLPRDAARMLAVEILLAKPESLERRRPRKLPVHFAGKNASGAVNGPDGGKIPPWRHWRALYRAIARNRSANDHRYLGIALPSSIGGCVRG